MKSIIEAIEQSVPQFEPCEPFTADDCLHSIIENCGAAGTLTEDGDLLPFSLADLEFKESLADIDSLPEETACALRRIQESHQHCTFRAVEWSGCLAYGGNLVRKGLLLETSQDYGSARQYFVDLFAGDEFVDRASGPMWEGW